MLSLNEAVERWHRDGQFLMTEVNSSDSYEGDNVDIPAGDRMSTRISKIEAFLAGQGFVKEIHAIPTDIQSESVVSSSSDSSSSSSE